MLSSISPGGSCWPPLRLLFPFQCPPSEADGAPAQQAEQHRVSAIHLLLPCSFGEPAGCQPISLCSPHGKSGFILESLTETWHLSSSITALPSSLIMISSLPAPEPFGFADLTLLLPFSQHLSASSRGHWVLSLSVLPFDA